MSSLTKRIDGWGWNQHSCTHQHLVCVRSQVSLDRVRTAMAIDDRMIRRGIRKSILPTQSQCGIVVVGSFSKIRGYVPRGGWEGVGVSVDGKLIGTVHQSHVWPLAIPLPPGRHLVEIRANRRDPEFSRRISLDAGEVVVIRFRTPRRRLFRGVSEAKWSTASISTPAS